MNFGVQSISDIDQINLDELNRALEKADTNCARNDLLDIRDAFFRRRRAIREAQELTNQKKKKSRS